MKGRRIVIVGAGFGGLSAAALLAYRGYDVTLVEKNELYGGRARVHKDKGFQFDMGPSWYLMPDVFEEFFALFDKTPADFYELQRLDPQYRIFFSHDNIVDVHADFEKNVELFDKLEPNGGKKLREFLDLAKVKYDTAMEGTLYKDYKSIFDLLSWDMLRKGTKLGVFGNLDDLVRKYFSSDEAIKILEYSIGFLGGSPKITPALYQLMSYVDFSLGVWFPEGGMGRVATSIYELAVEHGAHVVLGEDVTEIRVKGGRATTVVTDKREIDADVVVVNGDYPYTELQLIPEEYQTYDKKYWDSRILAPSAFVAYVGTDTVNDKLRHHSLFLDRDWAKNFDEIFESDAPVWPKSPSYYVNVPSKTDPGLAPPGGETLFILVPLAPGLEDTPELRERFFNQIMDHLESVVDMPIRDHIVSKRIFAVNDYAHDYHAYKGTALSIVHTLKQTAVWRPAHQSKKVHNLYYTGQYTHPGIGVPMTLIASQIVSDLIDKNEQ